MKLDKLTRKTIQQRCDPQVYGRGVNYFASGRVHRRMRTKRELKAEVHGTQVYKVSISERRGELIAICTCP